MVLTKTYQPKGEIMELFNKVYESLKQCGFSDSGGTMHNHQHTAAIYWSEKEIRVVFDSKDATGLEQMINNFEGRIENHTKG